MFKIKDSTIHCSRGDRGTITLKIPITDVNDNIKYTNEAGTVYWFNTKNNKIYDENYEETTNIVLDSLNMVFYKFQKGDKVTFSIYNKNGYDREPLMKIDIEVLTEADSVDIPLMEENTTFGNPVNKETIFWYDISLNDNQTVVGYNEDGAKEFILYPAKGDGE